MMIFPVIDPVATGQNILRLRKEKGLSVKDLQEWFHFDAPRAIYKWQKGETLPSVDNLVALSVVLQVPMEQILVIQNPYLQLPYQKQPQTDSAAAFLFLLPGLFFVYTPELTVKKTKSTMIAHRADWLPR